jgi:hypothetical protein
MYSMPPDHAAAAVRIILEDEALTANWKTELEEMRLRMLNLRKGFADALRRHSNSDRFDFIAEHRGMFSRLGITEAQVDRLREEFGIYMVGDSRFNVAGLPKTGSRNWPRRLCRFVHRHRVSLATITGQPHICQRFECPARIAVRRTKRADHQLTEPELGFVVVARPCRRSGHEISSALLHLAIVKAHRGFATRRCCAHLERIVEIEGLGRRRQLIRFKFEQRVSLLSDRTINKACPCQHDQ